MIDKPGMYTIPAEEYHADPCPAPSLSASIAKTLLAKSPLHAWQDHPRLNPQCERTEKKQYDTGTAAHALLLEGKDICVPLDFDDFRTKAAQEARDAARADGKVPLLRCDYETVWRMAEVANEAIANCPDLSGITLTDGLAEQTLVWQEGGVWCRARMDWIANERDLILDYKTTGNSANPMAWGRTNLMMGGDLQPAFYLNGNNCTGGPIGTRFVFLVQETEPPYLCSFVGMDAAYLAWSTRKIADAIRIWSKCLSTGVWPGYSNRICHLELPSWAEAQYEANLAAITGETR